MTPAAGSPDSIPPESVPMMTNDPYRIQEPGPWDCIEEFRPMAANLLAGFLLATLLAFGGAAAIVFPIRGAYLAGWRLPFWVEKGWSWGAVGIAVLLGIFLMACGVLLLVFTRGLIGRRVEVCAAGLRYFAEDIGEDVPWNEIAGIRETLLYERPPILKGPAQLILPKFVSAFFLVVTTSGRELRFDGNSIKGIRRFGEILREQAGRLDLPWETVEEHA